MSSTKLKISIYYYLLQNFIKISLGYSHLNPEFSQQISEKKAQNKDASVKSASSKNIPVYHRACSSWYARRKLSFEMT